MKKSDVIENEKCGIKWYKHVESFIGIDKIIEETIKTHKEFPDIWSFKSEPRIWANIHWAFLNAFTDFYREKEYKIPKFKQNGHACFNLDEVLTKEQIEYIKNSLCITEPYVDCWVRE